MYRLVLTKCSRCHVTTDPNCRYRCGHFITTNPCNILNREINLIGKRISNLSPWRYCISTSCDAFIYRVGEIKYCVREHCLRSSESSGVICVFYAYP